MGYVEESLAPGEEVVYRTRLHSIVMFWPLAMAALVTVPALALIVGSILEAGDGTDRSSGKAALVGGLVLLAIAAGAVMVGFARRSATEMAVTNRRLIAK